MVSRETFKMSLILSSQHFQLVKYPWKLQCSCEEYEACFPLHLSLIVHMCVCMLAYVVIDAQVWMCACSVQCFPHYTLHVQLTQRSPIQLNKVASSLWGIPCFCLKSVGIAGRPPCLLDMDVGTEDQNSGPPSCTASNSPTESGPQSCP